MVEITFSNILITSKPGYDSSLVWNNDVDGLYETGQIYEIQTTHSVQASTGSQFGGV